MFEYEEVGRGEKLELKWSSKIFFDFTAGHKSTSILNHDFVCVYFCLTNVMFMLIFIDLD